MASGDTFKAPLLAADDAADDGGVDCEATPPSAWEPPAPAPELPPELLEPVFFTDGERARQRRSCGRACGWVPVVLDLSWEHVRSRFAVAILLLQVACTVLLQVYLPKFGLDPIPFCVFGADANGLDLGLSVDEALRILNAFKGVWYAYFAISFVALQKWNGELWLMPATVMAWASFGVSVRLDAPSCIELAKLPPFTIPLTVGDDDGATSDTSSTLYAFYNLLSMILTGIVALELTRLTVAVVRKLLRGDRRWLLWGQVDDTDAADTGDARFCCVHSTEGRESAREQHVLVQFYREWLACVPLRHVAACMLSSVALIYFALTFVSFFLLMADFVASVRDAYANFDPNSAPPDFASRVIWALCLAAKEGLGDGTMGQIFGTAHDICAYAPYGFVVVALVCLAFIGHSFVAINKHHTAWVQLYSGHVASDPKALVAQAATPPLRAFGFIHATEYLLSHLLVHLAVASATSILVTIVATMLVTYAGGFPGLMAYAVIASRGAILGFMRDSWPQLLAQLVVLGSKLGVDVMAVVGPARALVSRAVLCFCVYDGPVVLAPRLFLNADVLISATLGSVLGVLDGFTRIIVAVVWGLLRCAMLHEPVVPMAAAGFDRPFQAYGGMMRAAHAAQLQRAAGGFGFGGAVITAAKKGAAAVAANEAAPAASGGGGDGSSGLWRSGQRAPAPARAEEYTYADAYLYAAATVD